MSKRTPSPNGYMSSFYLTSKYNLVRILEPFVVTHGDPEKSFLRISMETNYIVAHHMALLLGDLIWVYGSYMGIILILVISRFG